MSRILIADDHALVRGVLRDAVTSAGHQVVGEAADGEEVVRLARELRPHVVLMDLSMPGIDGVSATRSLRRHAPDSAVLVVTMHAEPELLATARSAGASGYLLKDASRAEIVDAVATVAAGGTAFDAQLAAEAPEHRSEAEHDLTDRELQVLQLLVDGASPKDVADALVVSPKTVGNHLTNIYRKLDVHSRTQAITAAIRQHLVDPPTAG